jgi:hypothetical protein
MEKVITQSKKLYQSPQRSAVAEKSKFLLNEKLFFSQRRSDAKEKSSMEYTILTPMNYFDDFF